MARIADNLVDVERCPHCTTPHPTLMRVFHSGGLIPRGTPGPSYVWAAYRCTSCGGLVLARGKPNENAQNSEVTAVFPQPKSVHEDIPEPARTFLSQAHGTLHAPDAAAVMAGSAVDAMLKYLGYEEGSLYSRIDKAVEEHKLTEAMGSWAHEVRLGSNRPRHADKEKPHVSGEEAAQSVEFADALAFFLFVLTARIKRGTEEAKKAGGQQRG